MNKDGSVFLEPGAAFAAAQDMARRQGTALTIGQRALWKRLSEKGLLASRDTARNRNVTRATINKNRVEVVHLIPGTLSSNGPNGPNDPPPGKEGGSGPKDGADSPPPEPETARKNGPNAAENGSSGPKGTLGPFSSEGPSRPVGQDAPRPAPPQLPGGDAHLVETEAGLRGLLPRLREVNRVALDLETTGLDPRKDRVRLLSLATEKGTWIIDCFEVDPRALFSVLAEKELVIHNALFDLGMLSEMGFELGEGGRIFDTMVSSQLSEGDYPEDEEEDR